MTKNKQCTKENHWQKHSRVKWAATNEQVGVAMWRIWSHQQWPLGNGQWGGATTIGVTAVPNGYLMGKGEQGNDNGLLLTST